MPTYTVQDPTTGRTLKLQGDKPPTAQELDQIFSQFQPQQQEKGAIGKGVELGFDVLNIPSFAVGGAMREQRQATANGVSPNFMQAVIGGAKGLREGFQTTGQQEPTVMNELAPYVGVDPRSKFGTALGFAGELALPDIPIGKAADVVGLGRNIPKLGLGGKVTSTLGDAGDDLLIRSFKLSSSDIEEIATALGVRKPEQYKSAVAKFIREQGFTGGATEKGMQRIADVIEAPRSQYDELIKAGKPVSFRQYGQALMKQADELESPFADKQTRKLIKDLKEEAQQYLTGKNRRISPSKVREAKKISYSAVPKSTLADPAKESLRERAGRAGIEVLEQRAPGSKEVGRKLKPLIKFQERAGKQAVTGKGTQLFNAFKPSAGGFGVGAVAGSIIPGIGTVGGGVLGALGSQLANSRRVQNAAGMALSGKTPEIVSKGIDLFKKIPKQKTVRSIRNLFSSR